MKNKVKELRSEYNWSQEKFAEILNVSRQTIISIEKGKYKPSLLLAFKIAKAFNTQIENIFTPDENERGK